MSDRRQEMSDTIQKMLEAQVEEAERRARAAKAALDAYKMTMRGERVVPRRRLDEVQASDSKGTELHPSIVTAIYALFGGDEILRPTEVEKRIRNAGYTPSPNYCGTVLRRLVAEGKLQRAGGRSYKLAELQEKESKASED